jgi:hypothetical protein
VERIPDSAAWAARKRKSIDWAFSELRAIVAVEGLVLLRGKALQDVEMTVLL